MLQPPLQLEGGSIYGLEDVAPASLEELGDKLLEGTQGYRCVGIEATGRIYPRLYNAIKRLDLVEQARSMLSKEHWATFMGAEVIGNQLSPIAFQRPLSQDAPRDERKRELLKNAIQAQVPLVDNILVGRTDQSERHAVEPGQIFVPDIDSQYTVLIPAEAVSMEMVFGVDFQAGREHWEAYIDAQPHPIT